MAFVGNVPISGIAGASSVFSFWCIIVNGKHLDSLEVRAIPLLQ
jgi:hypothetical protein